MRKLITIFAVIFTYTILLSCQTVSKKIDEKASKEEKELSKWLNQPEAELKIKCERKFEINPSNMIIGFSSKNCF
jgi:hypothetical protein